MMTLLRMRQTGRKFKKRTKYDQATRDTPSNKKGCYSHMSETSLAITTKKCLSCNTRLSQY